MFSPVVIIDMYTYAAGMAGVAPHYAPTPPAYLPTHHQLAAPGVPPPTVVPPLSPHTKRRR